MNDFDNDIGDWLKLRAVNHPKLSHLVDCLVFATAGHKASPFMRSGGDLDGNVSFNVPLNDVFVNALWKVMNYMYAGIKTSFQAMYNIRGEISYSLPHTIIPVTKSLASLGLHGMILSNILHRIEGKVSYFLYSFCSRRPRV